MPPRISIYLAIYALLLIAGGLIGFLKAKSRPSLIAGTTSGLIALAAAIWTGMGGTGGPILGLILSLAMAVVFAIRLSKTKKFMPSGLLLVVSALVAVALAVELRG